MKRCLQLAQKAFGHVSPNPMVGCVIVHNNEVIGEGYHQTFGNAHAEVNAINSIKNPELLSESTVYVSLEPCMHFGKTPPCTNLLIEKKVKKVVIGALDPFKQMAGKGVEMLMQAGIDVQTGLLEKECHLLNSRFFTYHTKNRPYIILKWAESSDGFIGKNIPCQISGLAAQRRLHQWRTEENAFLIGTNTLLDDNPNLSARLWKGKSPVRIAVDMQLKSDGKNLNFFNRLQRTIILNGLRDGKIEDIEYVKIEHADPPGIMQKLYEMNIQSVVLEGGAMLLESFIRCNLYDEIRRFKSKKLMLHSGIPAPKIDFIPQKSEDLMDDELLIYTK